MEAILLTKNLQLGPQTLEERGLGTSGRLGDEIEAAIGELEIINYRDGQPVHVEYLPVEQV